MSEKSNKEPTKESLQLPGEFPVFQILRVVFLFLLAVVISVMFFGLIGNFILALLMAAIIAGLAQPVFRRLMVLFRNRKAPAATVTVLLCLCLIIVPMLLLMGMLVDQAIGISEDAAGWVESLQGQKFEDIPILQKLVPYQDEILEKVGQLASKIGSFVALGLASAAKGTAEFILMLLITLFAIVQFLMNGPAILDAAFRLTPLNEEDKHRLLTTFTSVSRATFKGTLVIGIVQGGLAGLAFAVVGIKGALFWSVIMTVFSVIPGVGTAFVWVPAVIFLALNGQTGAAIGVALWCGLVVGTMDNILRPALVGKDTKMPDLLVLLTTLGGLILFGPAGIVIGPIIGALFITVWEQWSSAVEEAGLGIYTQNLERDNHEQ
jgi:predicted PurR-regulated permease PerM